MRDAELAIIKLAAGRTFQDHSHNDCFRVSSEQPLDEPLLDLEDGTWYELQGPFGFIAKLNAGIIQPLTQTASEQVAA